MRSRSSPNPVFRPASLSAGNDEFHAGHAVADSAVEFLLEQWETRRPMGPCHWGIGSRFLQVEYPFLRYNLFYYTYVLSFFRSATRDSRFVEAVAALETKVTDGGSLIIEQPHRGLKELVFCARGEPSSLATARLGEIRDNMG